MTTTESLTRLKPRYRSGISRENSDCGDLQNLPEALCKDVLVTNEPARVACGAPDIPVAAFRRDISKRRIWEKTWCP